ncbi:MAG: HEAT repeat domain-containing protein, partial [Fimbriimonadaceae bacterium]|nr:HEAT repeat domain-containing protein [Chitinophagales bacterium]
DRYDAINWLAYDHATNKNSYDVVVKGLSDPFWVIRQFAVDTIRMDANTPVSVQNKLKEMAMNDPRSYVRSTAIMRLGEIPDIDLTQVLNKTLQDSSYTVVSSALNMLFITDSIKAVQEARGFLDEENITLMMSVWDIVSRAGDSKDNDYFLSLFDKYDDWKVYYVMIYYLTYLQNQEDSYIINKGVDEFKKMAIESAEDWYGMFASSYLTGLKEYYVSAMSAQSPATQTQWNIAINYIDKALSEIPSLYGGDY